MEKNQLEVIVENSGLAKVEGKSILAQFGMYEAIAKDWEQKAKAIVVTDAVQVAEMKMAREGRLFLAGKRVAIEKARKELKEQSLRKGQAIDAIAKFLTSLIEPTEKYLKDQEDFVKILEARKAEEIRIEAERKAEEERIAKEEADRKEQERIRLENEKLHKEAVERERIMLEEREKADKEKKALEEKARLESEKAEAKRKQIELEHQEKLNAERAERERIEAELQAKKDEENRIKAEAEQAEAKRLADIKNAEKEEARRSDKDKFIRYVDSLLSVPQPELQDGELKAKVRTIVTILQGNREA